MHELVIGLLPPPLFAVQRYNEDCEWDFKDDQTFYLAPPRSEQNKVQIETLAYS